MYIRIEIAALQDKSLLNCDVKKVRHCKKRNITTFNMPSRFAVHFQEGQPVCNLENPLFINQEVYEKLAKKLIEFQNDPINHFAEIIIHDAYSDVFVKMTGAKELSDLWCI